MLANIIRRRKLGKGSTNGIADYVNTHSNHIITVIRNWIEPCTSPFIIRWGCTSSFPGKATVINSAKGIHRVSNKRDFRQLLIENNINTPITYFTKRDADYHFAQRRFNGEPTLKLIGRQSTHSQGRHAIIIDSVMDIDNDHSSTYWSEILMKQQEFRVYCFNGRIIAMAEKIPNDPTTILWNRAQNGSIFYNVKWDYWHMDVAKQALLTHNLSKLNHEGIDIMLFNNTAYVLESNSAPSLTSDYRKQCFGKAFINLLDYYEEVNALPPRYELPITYKNYKDVIHPSILN